MDALLSTWFIRFYSAAEVKKKENSVDISLHTYSMEEWLRLRSHVISFAVLFISFGLRLDAVVEFGFLCNKSVTNDYRDE